MNNAEKFKTVFGFYATELWAKTERDFLDWINAEYEVKKRRRTGKWQKLHGYATPGGDPVWCCSECGKGIHVWGVEHGSYGGDVADDQWAACPNCGALMLGEED